MYFRVLFLAAVLAPGMVRELALPLIVPGLLGAVISFVLWRRRADEGEAGLVVKNPWISARRSSLLLSLP